MPVLPSPKLLLFFVSLSFSKTKRAKALQIFVEHVESYSIFFHVKRAQLQNTVLGLYSYYERCAGFVHVIHHVTPPLHHLIVFI